MRTSFADFSLHRFSWLICFLPLATGYLTGCSPAPESATPSPSVADSTTPASTPVAGKKIKAGLVTDVGGVNDKSFNASAWDGMQKAQKEVGAEIKYTESRVNADYVSNLTQYAQNGYDVVFAVGFLMQDAVKDVAPKYPNIKFAIIDGDAPNLPNCLSIKFREEEGSYLAGALAGLVTKTNVIGFVGGMQMPLIEKFEAGYEAGAKATNPKVSVKVGYAGKFDDPQKGQELALSQMGAKADIIYHAAGKTGIGVIKAVQNKGAGFYAIGVDKDQDGEAPGRVLTSMVKRVDVAVANAIKSAAEGKFQTGTIVLGLKEDGVGLSPMQYTRKDIPPAALKTIEELKAKIIAGSLKPPTSK
jgi:basic membrane protein A